MEMLRFISPIITIALVLIMFGLGTSLQPEDFRRLLTQPRAALTGMFNQLILMPLTGMLFLVVADMPVLMSLGFAIVVACPGGNLSNLFSHLSRLDTALSVSLTALSTCLAVFTLPLWLQFSLQLLAGKETAVPDIPLGSTILQVLLTTVLPVLLGLLFRLYQPRTAQKVDRWARAFSIGFLTVIVIGATARDPTALVIYWDTLLPLFVLLNWSAMGLGYGTSLLMRIPRKQALTVMLETAFQNVPLAISITVLILNTEEAAFIPPIYGVAMMVNGSLFLGYRMWVGRTGNIEQRNTEQGISNKEF